MSVFKDQSDKTVSVKEGEAAIIDLPEIESIPPPDVTWQTDEGILPFLQKYITSKDNRLIILSVERSDQKSYR